MKNDNGDYNLIEDYFDGELTQEEEKTFNQKLIDDKAYARQFKFRKEIAEQLNSAYDYQKIKVKVKDSLTGKKRNTYYLYYSLAAMLLIFFGIYVIYDSTYRNKSESIAEANDSIKLQITPGDNKAAIVYYNVRLDYSIKKGLVIDIVEPDLLIVNNADNAKDTFLLTLPHTYLSGKYVFHKDTLLNGVHYWKLQDYNNNKKIINISIDSLKPINRAGVLDK